MERKADAPRFAQLLLVLSEVYGRVISEPVAEVWFQALEHFPLHAVEAAIKRHIKSPDVGQFMPKPADVVRMLEGTSLDTAMVAWAKVDKAVRSVGVYMSVAFDDPLVHRVVHDMGGWIGLGSKTESEWPFVGNEFRTRYTAFRSRQESPDYPARLVGLSEAENSRKGYAVGEVVLIGDPERARKVLAGGTDQPGIGWQRVVPKLEAVVGSNVRALPVRKAALDIVGEAK